MLNIKDFGAVGNGVADDTAAFLKALVVLQPANDQRGGALYIPSGTYKINSTLAFVAFDLLHNVIIYGDGPVCTTLDFSGAPPDSDGITFDAGSHFAIRDLSINGVRRDGVVILVGSSGGWGSAYFELKNLRVQGSGRNGVSITNAYMGTLDQLWVRDSGGIGVALNGFSTSLNVMRSESSSSGNIGWLVNGVIYSNFSSLGSDSNGAQGYAISNVRGVNFNGCGAEANQRDAFQLYSNNASTAGIPAAAQDVRGVNFNGCYAIGNSVSIPGSYASFIGAYTADGRSIEFSVKGGSAAPGGTTDRPFILAGSSGKVVCHKELFDDSLFRLPDFRVGSVELANLTVAGRTTIAQLSAATQSVPNNSLQLLSISNAPIVNDMEASVASSGIVVPKGVNKVRLSANVSWRVNTTGVRQIFLLINGVPAYGCTGSTMNAAAAGATEQSAVSPPISVNPGDLVTLQIYQNSGGNLDVLQGASTYLAVEAVC